MARPDLRTQRLCYQVRVYWGSHDCNYIRAVHYNIQHVSVYVYHTVQLLPIHVTYSDTTAGVHGQRVVMGGW